MTTGDGGSGGGIGSVMRGGATCGDKSGCSNCTIFKVHLLPTLAVIMVMITISDTI